MLFNLSIKSTVLLGLAALSSSANAICNTGEVGVGVSQLCNASGPSQPQCGGIFGAIFTNNCSRLGLGINSNICAGGYTNGNSVTCSGSTVTAVHTPGGNFGRCYKTSQRCDSTNLGVSSLYGGVEWCCKNNNS